MMRRTNRSLGIGILMILAACDLPDWEPDQLGLGKTNAARRQLETGREVYATYCVGCHGEKGDGNGPAARFLNPKPRDFHAGRLKFAAVASGEAPRDEDYFRIITHGLMGTSMPSFALLSERERLAVVQYVKTFYEGWAEDPPGGAISAGKDPFEGDVAKGVEAGKKAYHGLAKCWSCHPAYATREEITKINLDAELGEAAFRDNLYQSEEKDSQWGAPILPPDFLVDRIKNGTGREDIARIISAGVGGTAMPSWAGTLEPEQIWGIAYYVESLAIMRGTQRGRALKEKLGK